jgi:hypothetical protein
VKGLLFAFGTPAREKNEVQQNERKENKGERKVNHVELYTQYCGYKGVI